MSNFTRIDDAELAALRAELATWKASAEKTMAVAEQVADSVDRLEQQRDDALRALMSMTECGCEECVSIAKGVIAKSLAPWQPTPHDGSPEVVP